MGPPVPKQILKERNERREGVKLKVLFNRDKALNHEISKEIKSTLKGITDRFE